MWQGFILRVGQRLHTNQVNDLLAPDEGEPIDRAALSQGAGDPYVSILNLKLFFLIIWHSLAYYLEN